MCGGREYGVIQPAPADDEAAIEAALLQATKERLAMTLALHELNDDYVFTSLAHGDAAGADRFAGCWAEQHGIPVTPYVADWIRDGKRAGPIRNMTMLINFKPELVVGFPGGTGTAHMLRIAKEASIPTIAY